MSVEVLPVTGIPEVQRGHDLAGLIVDHLPGPLQDGDVVVVTQKAVSKAEGRVVSEDDGGKAAWVAREGRRVVARRDDLVIAETRHGFVCANAGVDASNIGQGLLTLLPEDPDASAAAIASRLARRGGADVAVVVSDTFGRPWRRGVVNVAIGCWGLPALVDLRGTVDRSGRPLEATVVAVADEVAGAAGLVMGKADGVPAAVVRGLRLHGTPGPARALVRPPEEDLFRHAPLEGIVSRRSIREFGPGPVPRRALVEAVAAALTAPVPHGSRHRSRPWRWAVLESRSARARLLDAMAQAWVRDLRSDGVAPEVIDRRLAKSDALLGRAPVLAVPAVSLSAADRYGDERRRQAERDMFVLATGAGVQNFMLALHAQGYASCWVSSTLFCQQESREALGLGPEWMPMGSVAAGRPPPDAPLPRPPFDPGEHLRIA